MPAFSAKSLERLASCDPRLQKVFSEVIKHWDCSITDGHRGEEEQEEAFRTGKSKLRFPNSPHNKTPSRAVDVYPYPIDFADRERFIFFAGKVLGLAAGMGIRLRSGGDWDNDGRTRDESFSDLPHFELVDP